MTQPEVNVENNGRREGGHVAEWDSGNDGPMTPNASHSVDASS